MAKTRAKKPATDDPGLLPPKVEPKYVKLLDPKAMHELLGLPGPYEPPPPPIPTKGYATFWDPGCSIQTLAKKRRDLFYMPDLLTERFAKDSDSWRWREIDLTPVGLNEPFDPKPLKGHEPPAARELVTFLVLHFLTTGERPEIPRLRCKDVTESKRRVIVGPFGGFGIEIANVSDLWKSPGIATCALVTPVVKRK